MRITLFKKCDFSTFVSWDKLTVIINFGKDVIIQFQKCDFSAFVCRSCFRSVGAVIWSLHQTDK